MNPLPTIRGALATPSGNEDDPWRRVILREVAGKGDVEIAPGAKPPANVKRFTVTGVGTYEVTRPTEGPLAGKIALVTGAAGAIGAGICRALVEKGAHVAACDIAAEPLRSLVCELNAHAPHLDPLPASGERRTPLSLSKGEGQGEGSGCAIAVTMDVTSKESVATGFEQVVKTWGGVDIVVVNAGIAMVAPLMELDVEAFRRLERVNVDGTLLTLAEAGRVLQQQGTGGDIILISTKNVFAPGAQFGAYSATKAASHQLARIASLEFAAFDVRVNMVAPDAVFADGGRKSGLWAAVGPSRMKARGLDEQGLEEYYRNRNLLKARVTANHVANAVLFFATRQTPTTGATIPVDGGLPDATPR